MAAAPRPAAYTLCSYTTAADLIRGLAQPGTAPGMRRLPASEWGNNESVSTVKVLYCLLFQRPEMEALRGQADRGI